MNPTKMAEKQRFLATTASEHPAHRFTNLYDLAPLGRNATHPNKEREVD